MSNYFNPPSAYLANVPVNITYYTPQEYEISAITFGNTTTITATEDVDYVVGQEIRLHIPQWFGARELNQQLAYVISLPAANQVEININTSLGVAPFIPSPTYGPTPPSICPIGTIRNGQINVISRTNVRIDVPGSFINISPN
jgi:hypothetical protein